MKKVGRFEGSGRFEGVGTQRALRSAEIRRGGGGAEEEEEAWRMVESGVEEDGAWGAIYFGTKTHDFLL